MLQICIPNTISLLLYEMISDKFVKQLFDFIMLEASVLTMIGLLITN